MKYYKEIDVDNFEIIVNKTLLYIKENTSLLTNAVEYNWHTVVFSDFINQVPELKTAFLDYKLIPNFVAFFVVYDNQTLIHRDDYNNLARINFPILNCENTYTNFYKNAVYKKFSHPLTNVVSYIVDNTDYELVDKIQIKKATVVRVLEAHKVDVPDNNPLPRITLTVGFGKDPVFLLKN